MKWLARIFPVQSRESEIECTVHACVNKIINGTEEFDIEEQIRIAHRVNETVRKSLEEEHIALMEKVTVYERALNV